MYNPYNWKIVSVSAEIEKECKRFEFEKDYEYFQRLMSIQTKYYAEYSINQLSYDLSIANLQDSIDIEQKHNKICDSVDFDLKKVISKRKELKKSKKKIKYIDGLINSIYK